MCRFFLRKSDIWSSFRARSILRGEGPYCEDSFYIMIVVWLQSGFVTLPGKTCKLFPWRSAFATRSALVRECTRQYPIRSFKTPTAQTEVNISRAAGSNALRQEYRVYQHCHLCFFQNAEVATILRHSSWRLSGRKYPDLEIVSKPLNEAITHRQIQSLFIY